uniref:Uncharacterized protein n=1 Tax=Panagrolaimus davidi TaxID=227884 RepID=A0A914QAD6_9BILA
MNQCPTMNETCFIEYPNGICEMYLPLMINGSVGNLHSNSRPIINNGHIFDGYYGGLMQPDANDLSWNDRKL